MSAQRVYKTWQGFVRYFHFISFIDSGCEAKDSQKSELNHYTSQEPKGEKTRKEVSVLDVGGKPQRIIPGKTHAIRQGLKTQST